ncbi:MAG: ATP-binding protein [Chloroflexota bacterium]
MSHNLADRLSSARHARFVGREGELDVFETAIQAECLPFFVLHIFGPGGVGKTTLLREFALMSERHGARPVYIDARHIDLSPDAFTRTLITSLGHTNGASVHDLLDTSPQRTVILVDTYEALTPLDGWLRTNFLPQLPDTVLTVFAGRNPPDAGWQGEPGWQDLVRVISLRNLSQDESRAFLTKRGLPADQQESALEFTHGHPLALSLVAEVFSQRGQVGFRPEESPDVVKTLMERFVQQVPGPAHRAALEACALVRVTTETLLGQMLAMPTSGPASQGVHELFEWLRELSFVESSAEGIFPHDLARETLAADLRWRNPDWYVELHHHARKYYTDRLSQTSGLSQQRLMLDTVFLHRENAVIRSFFDWQTTGSMIPYTLEQADVSALEEMVLQHEGKESAKLANHWFEKYPQSVTVWRDVQGKPLGFFMSLPLSLMKDEDAKADPAVASTRRYLATHAPLRSDEVATLFRFWIAGDTYQGISPIQSLIFIQVARHYLTTSGLAFTFFPCADPDFWAAILGYAELTRLPEADFEVGGKHYGVYGHDWRVMSPAVWIARLAEKEVGATGQAAAPQAAEPAIFLSREDFEGAVKQALQDFARPGGLTGNALLSSRLILDASGKGPRERSDALKSKIKEAADELRLHPRDEKLFRALEKTYFHPAPTQEAAAELLDLPFSTYRRHLTSGIQRLTEVLWQCEVREK